MFSFFTRRKPAQTQVSPPRDPFAPIRTDKGDPCATFAQREALRKIEARASTRHGGKK